MRQFASLPVAAISFAMLLGGMLAAPAPGLAEGAAPSSRGSSPSLALPIDCAPGRDCWVINYVDRDPGPGHRDYACGAMSYDTHKGTDIAIAHAGLIDRDVPVLAAAPGRVVGVRDNMEDIVGRGPGTEDLGGRLCGNGVRIDHGGGWSTQYCHMKKGSLAVRNGQKLNAGDRLGSVGLSGATQFPHVHMTVEKDGKVVDPFAGLEDADGAPASCGAGSSPLWKADVLEELSYLSPVMANAGFADRVPERLEMISGDLEGWAPGRDSPALVVWLEMYGVRKGDRLTMRLVGPSGEEIARTAMTLERTQNWISRAIGRRVRGSWAPGDYTATISLVRARGPGQKRLERTLRTRVN